MAHPSRITRPNPPGKQRRALSAAQAKGRLDQGGDPRFAQTLRDALTDAQEEGEIVESVTHPLHSYPARMHPATARRLIELTLDAGPKGPPVLLDPFCGSGTTLVEGRYAGARVVGVDANPLAVLIARAKIWTQPPAVLAELRDTGHRLAAAALAQGKAARRAGFEPPPLRAPRAKGQGLSAAERDRRLFGWFAPHVRRELEYLAGEIDAIRASRKQELADVLTVVLSGILYKVSRRASDTDPQRVERRVGRGAAARLFQQRVDLLLAGLRELADAADAPPGVVYCGDARELSMLDAGSISAVVTSPPYAGTYDYAEQHSLRLDFLGMPSEQFSAAEMGSRRHFAGDGEVKRRARRRWTRALAAALGEMGRVLRPGGYAAIVLGDSIAGDRAAFSDEVMAAALEKAAEKAGGVALRSVAWAWQERSKLGTFEREAFGDRPKRECIFLLEKSA